jgi:hypothetical protein
MSPMHSETRARRAQNLRSLVFDLFLFLFLKGSRSRLTSSGTLLAALRYQRPNEAARRCRGLYMYICMYVSYVYMYACMYACLYIFMHICINIFTHTHTHTHTHMYICPGAAIFAASDQNVCRRSEARRRSRSSSSRLYTLQYICPRPRIHVSHAASGMRHCPPTATHVSYTSVFIGHAPRSARCSQGGGLLRALF